MTIEVGMRLPEAKLMRTGDTGPELVDLGEKLRGRRVVLFGLPGAFTATCSSAHVPSFIRTKSGFDAKGIAEIICVSVNDPQVMKAWGLATGATEAGITMLADPACTFVEAIGLRYDNPAGGMLARCKRFAAIVNDGVVEVVHVEESTGVCDLSGGESLLEEA